MRIFRRDEEHLRRVTCRLRVVQQLRVHANVFDGKRTATIEKRTLLCPYGGNERREGILQVSLIESRLTGAQRSGDDKQCWLVFAQSAFLRAESCRGLIAGHSQ